MDVAQLLKEAQAQPSKQALPQLLPVIETLRDKGYSYREIAEFLHQKGVEVDHTRIYRLINPASKDPSTIQRRPIQVVSARLGGSINTKKQRFEALNLRLPSQLGEPIPVLGLLWGAALDQLQMDGEELVIRRAELHDKTSVQTLSPPVLHLTLVNLQGEEVVHKAYLLPDWASILPSVDV